MRKLSIILVTHNRTKDIDELLIDIDALNHKSLISNAVILDNGCSPPLLKRELSVTATWLRSETNLGATGGRNLATNYATGDILVYFDDDVNITDKDILIKILNSFSDDSCGLVAFNVLYKSTMKAQLDAFPHKYLKYGDLKSFKTYFYAACGYAIKRLVWEKIGGYPENFYIYQEEYDLSYRLIEAGYSIIYNSDIVILHKKSPESHRTLTEETKLNWINKGRVAFKYLPKKYFYSSVVMWFFEFIKKSKFNFKESFHAIKTISKIAHTENRTPISKKSLEYLKNVKARLWY